MSRRDKKEEEDGISSSFQNLDKTTILQEARYFNESPVNPRKCIHIITKIIYLLNQGQSLSTQEVTDLFFATTKLFQSKDVMLRRLVYLCIKELSTLAQDGIIVTSSLTKDMTGKEDLYRAAANRALCSITDSVMLQAIERYMKQALVHSNPAVSSAALVSALHLSANVPDLVRRWVNEAQDAISSDHPMVSCHAFAVVDSARSNNRLSTVKLVTTKHPNAVAACAVDLENLISDQNHSVATLAVTTLLATGAESSIDRLMNQISGFMSEISDEFKIEVVNAIKRLCSKYPRKHQLLAEFLAGMLRDEGGLQYKCAIIADALMKLVEENPDAKETGLAHLCEFIEDCEHAPLAVRILHILGQEGPKTRQPSRYIRYICNRVILESGPVRAAAVSAMARFGAARPELLSNILVLLERSKFDNEDEFRDRAFYYCAILNSGDLQLINDYITNIQIPNPVLLEKALFDHITLDLEEPFNIASVPTVFHPQKSKEEIAVVETQKMPTLSREEKYANELKDIPGIEKLGPIFKSCELVELTEPETEYLVSCVKHIFAHHLILQFQCVHTISDQLLDQVDVCLEPIIDYQIISHISCDQLPYDKQGSVFVVCEFPMYPTDSLVSIRATLEFVVYGCDAVTGQYDGSDGYCDTCPIEEIEIGCADQFRVRGFAEDWEASWERAASAAEVSDTFDMSESDVGEAANAVCNYLGLPKTAITGDAVKEIRGGGLWRTGVPVMLRARLVAAHGVVTVQLFIRSPEEEIATLMLVAVD